MNEERNKTKTLQPGEIILTTLPGATLGDVHNETPTEHQARLQWGENPDHELDDEDSCRA